MIMDDYVCPWCGADLGIMDLIEYDDAQAEHALSACEVWQREQGYITIGESARIISELL